MVTVELGTTDDADAVADRWVELAEGQRAFGSHLLAGENRTDVREAIVQSAIADELLVAREEGEGSEDESDDGEEAGDGSERRATGEIVGFITFTVESGTYEQDVNRGVVQNVYVADGFRSEGIGSELLAEAEARMAAAGAEAVALEVMADNDDARRFYRRHGYAPHRVELEKPVESDTLTKE